jgi:hypothetical protein
VTRGRESPSWHVRPPGSWRRSAAGLALCVALGTAAVTCEPLGSVPETRVLAEFGIFYGGQVQERQDIPLEVDATRQRQGFRLQLAPAPDRALEVRWELGMPGAGRAVPDSQGRKARPRKVQLGQAHWRPGTPAFEQVLQFSPGDPLGLWNIRVLVGSQVVIDRPFEVYDGARRARASKAHAAKDAGF